MSKTLLTRRSFVQAAAATGVAAAFGVSMSDSLVETDKAYAEAAPSVKTYKTMCHGCIDYCAVKVTLEDGVAVKIVGDETNLENRTSCCMKCLNQLHTAYSPRRILHPMKLAGERGSGEWEIISWDEAIDLAASKISESIKKYGYNSIFTSHGGGGSYNGAFTYGIAESFYSPTAFEPGGAQCFVPRSSITPMITGCNSTSIADSFNQEPFKPNTETNMLVIWATQPSISQTAKAGRGMAELRAKGCKTTVIDPNFSPDAAKADVWLPVRPGTDTALVLCWMRYIVDNGLYDEDFCKYWTTLPFLINPETSYPWLAEEVWPDYQNPAADPNDKYSTPAYVCFDKKTNSIQPLPFTAAEDSPVDPELLTEVEVNGKMSKTAYRVQYDEAEPWTLDATAEHCWLRADKIEEAIKLYTEADVAGIAHGVATDQQRNASQMALGTNALDIMMGYVEKPGSTITLRSTRYETRPTQAFDTFGIGMWNANYGYGWQNGYTESFNRKRYDEYPNKETQKRWMNMLTSRLGMDKHKGMYWQNTVNPQSVLQAIRTGEPFKPRVWFDTSGNKLAMLGNAQSWYDIFPEIDFCIGQHPIMTSFHYEACDLFLPLREWLELNMTSTVLNQTYMFTELIHLGETVDNTIPAGKIRARTFDMLGEEPDPAFPAWPGNDSEEAIRQQVADTFGAPSWEELKENQDDYVPLVIPEDEYWTYYQYLDIVDDGLPAGFATESRKCEPYCATMVKASRTGFPYTYPIEMPACEDYPPVCVNVDPVEDPTTDTEYPLVITSGRVPYFHHGTMRQAAFAREIYPVPDVKINPRTAAEYGIEHGEWVRISSRRGSISARAYLTEGEAPGQLWMERFWNPECFDDSQKDKTGGWRECNINILTNNFIDYEGDENPYNDMFGSYTLRGFTVKIEKGEKPANVWVEPEEFEPFMPTLQAEPQTGDVF